jgi:predicted TIM-barrel fold metal-dependent hydrolase
VKGVDSPVLTQVVSNEELTPRRQSEGQKRVEHLIGSMATERAAKLGMDRKAFLRSSMGMATCFLASNQVYGDVFEVDEAETWDQAASAGRPVSNDYFIMDVQAHFTDGYALGFRDNELIRGMGFKLSEDKEAYSYKNFVKEMFLDSETSLVVISGVPGREVDKNAAGDKVEGRARGGGILPSWLMSHAAREINTLAGSERAVCQGNLAPNHYKDRAALLDQMDREVKQYGIKSWKWYCHSDPGRSGGGFQLDDENAAFFYSESRKRGIKLFSVHKGYSYQSKTLGHLANPKDVETAALDNPDLSFVIYHSAMEHGPFEPQFKDLKKVDPVTGDMSWHNVLMDIKRRNPKINNVYPELGSFFNVLVIANPTLAMHGVGKNIKTYGVDHVIWGTDCLWWGSPQWCIDAFKRFQISDELCEKFGYSKLTREDKACIFGLNAAKLYGIDPKAKRKGMPADALDKLKAAYSEAGGQRDNAAYGWVRADD